MTKRWSSTVSDLTLTKKLASKRGRVHIAAHSAAAHADEERRWKCRTCDTMIETNEGACCNACTQYWTDVENGIFDNDY